MSKRLFLGTAVALALCAALGICSCHSGSSNSEANAATMPSARVAVAQRGDVSHVLTLAGQFQPYQVVDVHPKVSGYMKRINVDIGDIVHEGETLAILEVPELKAQLQGTVFELKQSQEEIARAQHEVASAEALNSALHAESDRLQQAAATRPGLIAQQELDDAKAKDLNSQAQVDAAKSAWPRRNSMPRPLEQTTSACRRSRLHHRHRAHRRRCHLAFRRYRRSDSGRNELQRPGASHRAPIAKRAAASPRSGAGRRHQVCPRGRFTSGARGCYQSLLHRQDCALYARCELRDPNHGDRSGRGEQGSLHRARHVRQHRT